MNILTDRRRSFYLEISEVCIIQNTLHKSGNRTIDFLNQTNLDAHGIWNKKSLGTQVEYSSINLALREAVTTGFLNVMHAFSRHSHSDEEYKRCLNKFLMESTVCEVLDVDSKESYCTYRAFEGQYPDNPTKLRSNVSFEDVPFSMKASMAILYEITSCDLLILDNAQHLLSKGAAQFFKDIAIGKYYDRNIADVVLITNKQHPNTNYYYVKKDDVSFIVDNDGYELHSS